MRTIAEPAGWVAVEGDRSEYRVVWGTGPSAEAALDDAGRDRDDLVALPASERLLDGLGNAAEPMARVVDGYAWDPDERSEREEAEAQAAAAAAEAKIPAPAQPWADHRRAMIRLMVLAALRGHPAVRLSSRGQPVWSAQAPLRTGPDARGEAQLGQYLDDALDEMSQNLGDDSVRRKVDLERIAARTRRLDRLASTAEAIFGPEWVAPLSRQSGVGLRTAQRWAAGEAEPRDVGQVIQTLQPLASHRRAELLRWLDVLDSEFPATATRGHAIDSP